MVCVSRPKATMGSPLLPPEAGPAREKVTRNQQLEQPADNMKPHRCRISMSILCILNIQDHPSFNRYWRLTTFRNLRMLARYLRDTGRWLQYYSFFVSFLNEWISSLFVGELQSIDRTSPDVRSRRLEKRSKKTSSCAWIVGIGGASSWRFWDLWKSETWN